MAAVYDYEYYNPPSYEVNNDFVNDNHPSYQYEYYDPSAQGNLYPELPNNYQPFYPELSELPNVENAKKDIDYDDINPLMTLITFGIFGLATAGIAYLMHTAHQKTSFLNTKLLSECKNSNPIY
jgi:hypothetical protein